MLTLSQLSANFFFYCLLYCYDNNTISDFNSFDNQISFTMISGVPTITYWSNSAPEPSNAYLMSHYNEDDYLPVKTVYSLQQRNAPILITVDDDLLTVINADTAISNGQLIYKVPENEIWLKTGTSTWIAISSAPALSSSSLKILSGTKTPPRKMSTGSLSSADTLDDFDFKEPAKK